MTDNKTGIKTVLNLILTHVGDPIVRKVLEAWLTGLPPDHWVWKNISPQLGRDLAAIVGEQGARLNSPFGQVTADKISDWMEVFSEMIQEGPRVAGKRATPTPKEVKAGAEDWWIRFMAYAEKKINSAKPENLPALKAQLIAEFEIKTELWEELRKRMEAIQASRLPPVTPAPPLTTPIKATRKKKSWIEKEIRKAYRKLDKLAKKGAPHVNSFAERLWDTPLTNPNKESLLHRTKKSLVWIVQVLTLQQPSRAAQFRDWAKK